MSCIIFGCRILRNLALFALIVLTGFAIEGKQLDGVLGDYGDAPDNLLANYNSIDPFTTATFPVEFREAEDTAFVLHRFPGENVFLGEEFTLEHNAKLLDKDEDDGWVPGSFAICKPARFDIHITIPEEAVPGPIYLNALFDWNHDARWTGANDCPASITVLPGPGALPNPSGTMAAEWAIQNLRLDLLPYELKPGFSGMIRLPPILTGALQGEMWSRFTISTVPVDEEQFEPFGLGGLGWDGRGDFLFGESEDYFTCLFLEDAEAITGCPEELPQLPDGFGVVSGNEDQSTPPANQTSEEAVALADLSLEKSVNDPTPNVGDKITYVVSVHNAGPDTATDVFVEDILPAGLSFVGSSATQGAYDGNIIWVIGTMEVGSTVSLQILAKVNGVGTFTNTAQINSSNQPDPDSTPGNNNVVEDDQDSVPIDVTSIFSDLAITKVDSVDPVSLGGNLTWTLTVSNDGPFDATNVIVSDAIPTGILVNNVTPTQGTCDATVICSLGTVAIGAVVMIAIDVTVDPGFAGITLNNTATVSSDNNDSSTGNNTASETTAVDRESDLSIAKTDSADSILAGQNLTWTITVNNQGPAAASNVQVSDPLPAGVALVSAVPSQGSCDAAVTCDLGTIVDQGNATITIEVVVDAAFSGAQLANTATVSSINPDPVSGNDSATESTAVNSETDLAIVKTGSPAVVVAGQDSVIWTLTVSNNGPSDAAAVVVSDALPVGLSFVSATPSAGSCNESGGTVTCNLGTVVNGATVDITIETAVDASATGTINNGAVVSTTTTEPNLANNLDNDSVIVNASADLGISKGDNVDPVVAGQNLIWTLTVTNSGPSDAQGVTVSDPLPAGVTLVSAVSSQGGTCDTTVSCSLDTIVAQGSATVTITATVNADFTGGSLSNTAMVSATTNDPNDTNDSATEPTAVNTVADVGIAKTDSPDPVLVGNNLTWTLTVSNDGPSDAQGVMVSDPLPAGVTLVSAVSSQGGACDTTVSCSLGTIADQGNATITVIVTVDAGFVGSTLSNTATVSATTSDPNATNDSASEPTAVEQGVDLSITKGDDADPIVAGNNLIYTLTVNNAGPDAAQNVTVSDPLPTGVTAVSADPSQGTCDTTVSCSLGTIANLGNATVTITVTVNADFTGGSLSNTATVATTNIDTNSANDSATEPTLVNTQTNLVLTKTVSPTTAVAGQDSVSWTIQVQNQGPSDATSTVITDILPAGVTFVSADAPCTESGGTITCNLDTFVAGANQSFTVVTSVDADASGTIVNPASVTTSTPETTTADNSDTAQITVSTAADVGITKIDTPDPVLLGNNITYTLTVTNNGPSAAQNVSVSDPVPANTTFVSAGAGCTQTGGIVTCNAGTLAPSGTAQFTVTVLVDGGFGGSSISNTATVSTTTTDSNETNDSATEPTAVEQGVDMSITKTDSVDPVIAGNQFSYTLIASNAGPATASAVQISDPLPAGTTLVSATGTGWSCSGTTTVTCTLTGTLDVAAANPITVTVTVDPGTASGAILSNTATVSTSSIELNPGNDSATQPTAVITQADLGIVKTDSVDPVLAGNQLSYTLTVTNNGPSNAASVSVIDTLPATGVTFVSATGTGWSCSGATTITCTRATATVGVQPVITVTVTVNPDVADLSTLTNNVSVSTTTTDPVLGNDMGSEVTTVNTQADMLASKTASISTVRAGESFSYFITVLNNGPSDAQNVQTSDTLPIGVLFQAVSPDQGSCPITPIIGANGTVGCDLGTIAAGGFATITLQVSMDASFTGGNVDNTATVIASTTDPSPGNNISNVATIVTQVADISIGVVDSPNQVRAGELLTYTISVINNGPSDAQNVQMTNPFPSGVTLSNGPTITQGSGSCTSGATITCSFGTLANQATAEVQYTILVDQDFPTSSLSNDASATSATTDTQPGNNSDSTATTVSRVSDLTVTSITDIPDPATRGGQLTYTINVSNLGPSQSADATVTVNLASGLTFVSSTPTQGSCSPSGQVVTCSLGAFNSGSSATITVVVDVEAGAANTVLTNASISTTASTDPVSGNNSAVVATTVQD